MDIKRSHQGYSEVGKILTVKVKHDSGSWEIIPEGTHGRGPIIRLMEDVDEKWIAEHWDSGSCEFGGTPRDALMNVLKVVSGKEYSFNPELEGWVSKL